MPKAVTVAMADSRKTNQLDIDLNVISDIGTRSALSSIMDFVNRLTSQGISTSGPVEAREYALTGNEFGFDRNGNLSAKSLSIDGQGQFKVMVKQGTIGKDATITFTVPGNVIGAVGYFNCKDTASAGGGTNCWRVMGRVSTTGEVFFSTSSEVESNQVRIISLDANHAVAYNLIIFHVGLS